MAVGRVVLLLMGLALEAQCYLVLENVDYTQLNDVNGAKSINASTYNRIDFDYDTNILYVTAKEPGRLTVFSIGPDGTTTQLTEKVFDIATMGQPLDVEFCRPTQGSPARVAVSFEDPSSPSAEGVVRLYNAMTPTNTDLTPIINPIAVGAQPVDIEFAEDCMVMLVANRGRPTREGDEYRDPEGTITKILMPPNLDQDSPIVTTTIAFDGLFTGPGSQEYLELLRESNFRHYPLRNPDNTLLTVMQNLEPENIVISPNFLSAFVSMPKNNAVARLNLETNMVTTIFPLGNRSWTDYYMDPSDADNEVFMRGYNIYSMLQPTQMAWVSKGGSDWLVMLDTGRLNDNPAYGYTDFERGRTLMQNGDVATSDSNLEAQLLDDTELGRLYVSTEDGRRASDGKIGTVFTFGGRGFSIHNANTFKLQSGVVDNVEQVTKQYYRSLFNTAFQSPDATPIIDAEATSPTLGPNLGALTVGEYGGKTLMFLGSETSGVLYVYQLDPDADCPQPVFHSLHRQGTTGVSWQQAFDQGSMGDIGINDMMYLTDTDLEPVLVVASSTSNSISVYRVLDAPFTPQPVGV